MQKDEKSDARLDPNREPKTDTRSKPTNDRKTKDKETKASRKPPEEKSRATADTNKNNDRWGDLLPKTYDDAEKARGTKVPNKMRDSFEKYLEEVNKK